MADSLYEGKFLSSSAEGAVRFINSAQYSAATNSFLSSGRLKGATVYDVPEERYRGALSGAQYGSFSIDKRNDEDSESNLNKVKAAAALGFRTPLGAEQSLHFKSYTRVNDSGNIEAYLPTGNLTNNARDNSKQTNLALFFTGRAASKVLEVQKYMHEGTALPYVELGDGYSLSRGDVTSVKLSEALASVRKGDVVRVGSPFISSNEIISLLSQAKERGADVKVINSPGYRTSPEREKLKKRLADAGLDVYTSDKDLLIHSKFVAIKGKGINLAALGSDNLSASSRSLKSLDYMTLKYGNSSFLSALLGEADAEIAGLKKVEGKLKKAKKESVYSKGEFGFLYQTEYQTFSSTKNILAEYAGVEGFIKPTSLRADYFDRHIKHRLPQYHGFAYTYEAITGFKAPDAVTDMDKAVGAASAGHQINRLLGMRLYTEGKGLIGSAVAGVGRFLDFITGNQAFRDDVAVKRGDTRGTIRKFEAQINKSEEAASKFKGGPFEQSLTALYSAAQGFVISAIGYGAVLAFQYGLVSFVEEGVKRSTELGRTTSVFQKLTVGQFLSPEGREVMRRTHDYLYQPSSQGYATHKAAYHAAIRDLKASGVLGVSSSEKDLLAKGPGRLVNVSNALRRASASFMDFVLPSIVDIIVPKGNLEEAQAATRNLIEVIGRPIELKDGQLINLKAEHSKHLGSAIEKLGQFIPLKLHYWVPALRDQTNAHTIGPDNPSLAKVFGENFLNQTIGAFIQTTERAAQMLQDPKEHLDYLAKVYKQSRILNTRDNLFTVAHGITSKGQIDEFLEAQANLSKLISKYQPGAPALTQSLEAGIRKKGGAGRFVFGLTAALAADFMLDQFVLKTQGANLIDQIRLTKAVRDSEGKILQIEFNATMPVYGSLAVAGTSALATGYLFPTIYGVRKDTNKAFKALVDGGFAEAKLASVRARFNYKAAFIGMVLGVTAAKAAFVVGAGIANLFLPAKGVKTDPSNEVAMSRILGALLRSRGSVYNPLKGETDVERVRDGGTFGDALTREMLKETINALNVSETTLNKPPSNSSFYSIALQLTNTSFLQTAILQRTDAAKGITVYSFGMQLMPAAGIGITPLLPFGITNRFTTKKKDAAYSYYEYAALSKRYGLEFKDQTIVQKLASGVLSPFEFLAYSPNSQITNTIMSLGTMQLIGAVLDIKKSSTGTKAPNLGTASQDIATFAKGIKFATNLTESILKYNLALTDLLPRMVAKGVSPLLEAPGIRNFKPMLSFLNKSKFGLMTFAIGAALTDPILGVDPIDQKGEQEHFLAANAPFANPINRLVTTGLFAAYATTALKELGVVDDTPKMGGLFSRVIPGAAKYQRTLLDPAANNIRKSGARAGLVAGLVFTTYIASSIVARTIGQFFGDKALNETYNRVGLLRIFSGVKASDYSAGERVKRNVIKDVAADIIGNIPIVGKSITKITGLYKDDPNLFLPFTNTPFGVTYRDDGTIRPYTQNQSGTTDASISSYTKFMSGLSADIRNLRGNLEAADISNVTNPDKLVEAIIRGGPAKTKLTRVTNVSEYTKAAINSPLLMRAFRRRLANEMYLRSQRASELSFDELKRQYAFGKKAPWGAGSKTLMTTDTFGFNEGVEIVFQALNRQKEAITLNSGGYNTFESMVERSAVNQRNVYKPRFNQGFTDLFDTFFPQQKDGAEGSRPRIGAVLLGASAIGMLSATYFNLWHSATHFISALEVVKHGKSLAVLEDERMQIAKDFKRNVGITIKDRDLDGLVTDELGRPAHLVEPKNKLAGLQSTRRVNFIDSYGTTANDYLYHHKSMVGRLEHGFNLSPHALKAYGKSTYIFDDLLKGDIYAVEHLKSQFGLRVTGELGRKIGKTTMFDILVKGVQDIDPTETVHSYVGGLLDKNKEAYSSLTDYARKLKGIDSISDKQKREMLNIRRIKIERQILENNIFLNNTNYLDELPPENIAPVKSGSLGGKVLKFGGAAGTVLGGYFAFGRDAYAMAEGSVFLLSSDRDRRRLAAESLYDTTTSLSTTLLAQKAVASVMGKNQYSLGVLALSTGILALVNTGIAQLEKTSFGGLVKKLEKIPRNIVTAGLDFVGDTLSNLTRFIFDPIANGLFIPLGQDLQNRYNDLSKQSVVTAMLAEMLLPSSIFKTSNYMAKKTAYGYMPYQSTKGDLQSYYRQKNQAGILSTMSLEPQEIALHPFLMGQYSGFKEKYMYDKFFNMSKRVEGSAISGFSIQSSYQISALTMYALKRRSSLAAYYSYGSAFRRAKLERHDYIGQALSGLGTTNELTRFSQAKGIAATRLLSDEYEMVRQAIKPVGEVFGKYSRQVSAFVDDTFSKLGAKIQNAVNVVTRPLSWLASLPFRLATPVIQGIKTGFGRLGTFTASVFKNIGDNTLQVIEKAKPVYEEAITEISDKLTRAGGPVAEIALRAGKAAMGASVYGLDALSSGIRAIPVFQRAESSPKTPISQPSTPDSVPGAEANRVNYRGSNIGGLFKGLAKSSMHFFREALPTILDAAQIVPSTFSLLKYDDPYMTRSQTVRLYEQQGAAVGATLAGLAALATGGLSLIPTILIGLTGAYVGGQLGAAAGGEDYKNKNKTFAYIQSALGAVTLGLSAGLNIYNYVNKIKLYNNYVEVQDGKARIVYDQEYNADYRKEIQRRRNLAKQPDSFYRNFKMRGSNKNLMHLLMERHHERAHIGQFDKVSKSFTSGKANPKITDVLDRLGISDRADRVRFTKAVINLSQVSAQQQLVDNPSIDRNTYRNILKLEREAHWSQISGVLDELDHLNKDITDPSKALNNRDVIRYIYRKEKQLTTNRFLGRRPSSSVGGGPDIERLYSSGSDSASQAGRAATAMEEPGGKLMRVMGTKGGPRVTSTNIARLMASGFGSSGRLLAAAATILAVPTALYEAGQIDRLSNLQRGMSNPTALQTKTQLENRGIESVRQTYGSARFFLASAITKNPAMLLLSTALIGLGQAGATIPFTNISLMSAPAEKELARRFAQRNYERMERGDHLYEYGKSASTSINALRNTYIDDALKESISNSVDRAKKVGLKYAKGVFKDMKTKGLKSNWSKGALGLGIMAALAYANQDPEGAAHYGIPLAGMGALAYGGYKYKDVIVEKTKTVYEALPEVQKELIKKADPRSLAANLSSYIGRESKELINQLVDWNRGTTFNKVTGLPTAYADEYFQSVGVASRAKRVVDQSKFRVGLLKALSAPYRYVYNPIRSVARQVPLFISEMGSRLPEGDLHPDEYTAMTRGLRSAKKFIGQQWNKLGAQAQRFSSEGAQFLAKGMDELGLKKYRQAIQKSIVDFKDDLDQFNRVVRYHPQTGMPFKYADDFYSVTTMGTTTKLGGPAVEAEKSLFGKMASWFTPSSYETRGGFRKAALQVASAPHRFNNSVKHVWRRVFGYKGSLAMPGLGGTAPDGYVHPKSLIEEYSDLYRGIKREAVGAAQRGYKKLLDSKFVKENKFIKWFSDLGEDLADWNAVKRVDPRTGVPIQFADNYYTVTRMGNAYKLGDIPERGLGSHMPPQKGWRGLVDRATKMFTNVSESVNNLLATRGTGRQTLLKVLSAPYRYVYNPAQAFVRGFKGAGPDLGTSFSTYSDVPSYPMGKGYKPTTAGKFVMGAGELGAKAGDAWQAVKGSNKWNTLKALPGKAYSWAERKSIALFSRTNKLLANALIQQGLLDTSLNALSIANDAGTLASGTAQVFGLSYKSTRKDYQKAYVDQATGRSGLITTLALIPALGVVKGLAASFLLTSYQQGAAEAEANLKYEAYYGRDINGFDKTALAAESIRDSIQQTLAANFVSKVAQGYKGLALNAESGLFALRKAEALKQLMEIDHYAIPAVGKLGRSGLSAKSAPLAMQIMLQKPKGEVGAYLSRLEQAQARAVAAFGKTGVGEAVNAAKASKTAEQLAEYSAKVGGVATKGLSKFAGVLNVGLVGYYAYQSFTAKTAAAQREAYGGLGESIGSVIGGAIGGFLGGSATGLATLGIGTAAGAIGGNVVGSVIGGEIGRNVGTFIADVKNFNIGQAFLNMGRDFKNNLNNIGAMVEGAGVLAKWAGGKLLDAGKGAILGTAGLAGGAALGLLRGASALGGAINKGIANVFKGAFEFIFGSAAHADEGQSSNTPARPSNNQPLEVAQQVLDPLVGVATVGVAAAGTLAKMGVKIPFSQGGFKEAFGNFAKGVGRAAADSTKRVKDFFRGIFNKDVGTATPGAITKTAGSNLSAVLEGGASSSRGSRLFSNVSNKLTLGDKGARVVRGGAKGIAFTMAFHEAVQGDRLGAIQQQQTATVLQKKDLIKQRGEQQIQYGMTAARFSVASSITKSPWVLLASTVLLSMGNAGGKIPFTDIDISPVPAPLVEQYTNYQYERLERGDYLYTQGTSSSTSFNMLRTSAADDAMKEALVGKVKGFVSTSFKKTYSGLKDIFSWAKKAIDNWGVIDGELVEQRGPFAALRGQPNRPQQLALPGYIDESLPRSPQPQQLGLPGYIDEPAPKGPSFYDRVRDWSKRAWDKLGKTYKDMVNWGNELWEKGASTFNSAATWLKKTSKSIKDGLAWTSTFVRQKFDQVGYQYAEAKHWFKNFFKERSVVDATFTDYVEEASYKPAAQLQSSQKTSQFLLEAGEVTSDVAVKKPSLISKLIDWMGRGLGAVGKGIDSFVNAAALGVESLVGGIGKGLSAMGKGINSIVNTAALGVEATVGAFGKGLSAIGKGVSSFVNTAALGLEALVGGIGKGAGAMGRFVSNIFNRSKVYTGEIIEDFIPVVQQKLFGQTQSQKLLSAGVDVSHKNKWFEAVGKGFKAEIDSVGNVFKAMGKGITSFVNTLALGVEAVVGGIGKGFRAVGRGINSFINAASLGIEAVVGGIGRGLGAAGKWASNLFNRSKVYTGELVEDFIPAVNKKLFGRVSAQNLLTEGEDIFEAAEDVYKGVASAPKPQPKANWFESISKGIRGVIGGIGKGINSFVNTAALGVEALVGGIGKGLSAIGKGLNAFVNVMALGVESIVGGIGKGFSAVGRWMSNIFAKAHLGEIVDDSITKIQQKLLGTTKPQNLLAEGVDVTPSAGSKASWSSRFNDFKEWSSTKFQEMGAKFSYYSAEAKHWFKNLFKEKDIIDATFTEAQPAGKLALLGEKASKSWDFTKKAVGWASTKWAQAHEVFNVLGTAAKEATAGWAANMSKSLSNTILKRGLTDTILTGAGAAFDTIGMIEGTSRMYTLDSRSSKKDFQEAYVKNATGRAGMITTLGLIPSLGVIKGITVGLALTAYQQSSAEAEANLKYQALYGREINNWDKTAMAAESIRDNIQQTRLANLTAGLLAQNKDAVVAATPVVSTLVKSEAVQRASDYAEGVKGYISKGTGAVKGALVESKAGQLAKSLAASKVGIAAAKGSTTAMNVAKGATKVVGKFAGVLNAGLIGYYGYQSLTASTPEAQRDAYSGLGEATGSVVGGAIGTTIGAILGLGIGSAAGAALGNVIGSVIGGAIGGTLGALVADVKNYGVGKAISNIGRDFMNNMSGITSFVQGAGNLAMSGLNAVLGPLAKPAVEIGIGTAGVLAAGLGGGVVLGGLAAYGAQQAFNMFRKPENTPSVLDEQAQEDKVLSQAKVSKDKSLLDQFKDSMRGVKQQAGSFFTNLWKDAKTVFGSVAKKTLSILDYGGKALSAGAKALINNTTALATGALDFFTGGAFSGKSPEQTEMINAVKALGPGAHRQDFLNALNGNVFAGRSPVTVTFGRGAVDEVRGKTVVMDSSLKALSDVIAIKETTKATDAGSYTSQYMYKGKLNKNYGRYQIIYGYDTKELSSVIQGGITGTSPEQQDRAFLGRFFTRARKRGGSDYVRFTSNGYKYEDFKSMIQSAGWEWQSLRGSQFYTDTKAADNHLAKYYGSEEAGYKYLYSYFLYRKKMYEKAEGITPTPQAGPAAPKPTTESKFTPAQANKLKEDPKKQPPAPKPQAKPAPKPVVKAEIQLGKKTKTVAAASKTGLQPKDRPMGFEVALNLENGMVNPTFNQEANENTFNHRANIPASYRNMGGRIAQLA